MPSYDRADRLILETLQNDASLSNTELAERAGLSANACWRRIRRLEEQGIIRKQVALLSQEKLNLKAEQRKSGGVMRETSELARNGHFGLIGMQERAVLIGARLELRSTPGEGTLVAIALPTNRADSIREGTP